MYDLGEQQRHVGDKGPPVLIVGTSQPLAAAGTEGALKLGDWPGPNGRLNRAQALQRMAGADRPPEAPGFAGPTEGQDRGGSARDGLAARTGPRAKCAGGSAVSGAVVDVKYIAATRCALRLELNMEASAWRLSRRYFQSTGWDHAVASMLL